METTFIPQVLKVFSPIFGFATLYLALSARLPIRAQTSAEFYVVYTQDRTIRLVEEWLK